MGNEVTKGELSAGTKLSLRTLAVLPTNVLRPKADRAKSKIGIVHIGVGGFHRAHQALYLDDLMELGLADDWGICGVGLLPKDRQMRDIMKEQDCLYTLVERGLTGDSARIIGSIREYIFAPEESDRLLARLCSPDTKIVSLTITEGGYNFDQGTGEFIKSNPEIQHDLKTPQAPRSVFGFIVEALLRRRAAGNKPFTILSCDNLQGNGEVARKMFGAFAELRDKDLAKWITTEVAFPNSMVDRITPVTSEQDREMVGAVFGVNDGWPVVAEPFKQWIVEDHFCNGRPAWEKVGVQMTDDVTPYEKMKIRLLNAGHSTLGYLGSLAGFRYIFEIASDPEFSKLLRDFLDREVTEILDPVTGVDLAQYKTTVIDRFKNPNIKDTAARICMDGSAKMPKFVLPTVLDRRARGLDSPRAALTVAAWFRYLNGKDEQGKEIEINDPMAAVLNAAALKGKEDPSALMSLSEVFGDKLPKDAVFVKEVGEALSSLYKHGARITLKKYLSR